MGIGRARKGVDPFLIKREVFNSIFVSTYQRELVVRWPLSKKRIVTAVAKSPAHGTEPAPKEQFLWADGQRRRSYKIRWPRTSQTGATATPTKD
jgi:hypothetical protein